jgi:hypothetical protein
LTLLTLPQPLPAQGTTGFGSRDINNGYLDCAIPADLFQLRFDAANNDRRPNRAEFFYAQGSPRGPGLPLPETGVDFQDLAASLEVAVDPRLSAFVELPARFLNPEINANAAGLADMNAGFKWAFLYREDLVATFQLRAFCPTGDPRRGLGTGHVSLEPALLVYQPLTDRLSFEGELRYLVPVGGTDFAGDIVRYGIGFPWVLCRREAVQVVPVAELVGWTVLGGKETVVHPSGLASVQNAAGDTILNAKLGIHFKFAGSTDFYAGYGRPLTGERWYENIVRLEFRLFF